MSGSGSDLLPASWQRVQLGDLVVVHYGKALAAGSRSISGRVPVIGSSGVVGHHDQALVDGACLVVGRKGAAGAVHMVNKSCWPIDTAYFIKSPLGVELEYLHLLLALLPLGQLDKSTTIPSLSRDDLYRVSVPIAPEAEQTRIVEKLEELLSDLDAGVAELKAAQRKLVQYRQSLLKAAVEGALTADWRAARGEPQESGAQLLQRILAQRRARWEQKQLAKFAEQGKVPPKDWQTKYRQPISPSLAGLPELPKDWAWASLDMVGEIASGVAKGSKRSSEVLTREVHYLRVANVQRGYLDLTHVKTIEVSEADIAELCLQAGDVLFNEGGDLDKLGRGWVWRGEVGECIHQNHVFRMRPVLSATPSELISHHGNTFGKEWFKTAGKQTTNLASINMTMLRGFPVPVASEVEGREILSRLEPLLNVADEQERAISRGLAQAAAQRKNILKFAFSGQLVPQDPNDEPASVLLARIRAARGDASPPTAKSGAARRRRAHERKPGRADPVSHRGWPHRYPSACHRGHGLAESGRTGSTV